VGDKGIETYSPPLRYCKGKSFTDSRVEYHPS